MSSLYHYRNMEDENFRVIDSNDIIEQKIRAYQEAEARRKQTGVFGVFEAGLPAEEIGDGEFDALFEDQDASGLVSNEERDAILAEAQAEAEDIIAAAQAQADQMIADANGTIEELHNAAKKQGAEAGYAAGMQQAQEEIDARRKEIERERSDMLRVIDVERAQMESELVDTILDVFASVFCIQFADKKDLLLHLIQNTIRGIDGAKQFTIKVAPEKMRELEEERASIMSGLSSDLSIDILADSSLHDLDCVLETEHGIFECGPMVQLDNLIRDIKSLSYQK